MPYPTADFLPEQLARFWRSIEVTGFCWTWRGPTSNGYGVARYKIRGASKNMRAHRVAYELLVEDVPDELVCDHLCRNKMCVNPDHIEVVTQRENLLRGFAPAALNARLTQCRKGHELREVDWIPGRTRRDCPACRSERDAQKRAQANAA